jgi:hypothetical protein
MKSSSTVWSCGAGDCGELNYGKRLVRDSGILRYQELELTAIDWTMGSWSVRGSDILKDCGAADIIEESGAEVGRAVGAEMLD